MGCSTCTEYRRNLGRCVLGKINPPTVKGAVAGASLMGITYICNKFGMRDKVQAELTKRWQA